MTGLVEGVDPELEEFLVSKEETGTDAVAEALDRGRNAVVRSFDTSTSSTLHSLWGRKERSSMSPTLAPELDPISTDQYPSSATWTEVTEPGPEPWLEDALRRMAAFRHLPGDWDSYGSGPPGPRAFSTSLDLLYNAWRFSSIASGPTIVPMSGGGLQISWDRENRRIEIDIHPDGSATVLRLEDDDPIGDDEPLSSESVEGVLSWL